MKCRHKKIIFTRTGEQLYGTAYYAVVLNIKMFKKISPHTHMGSINKIPLYDFKSAPKKKELNSGGPQVGKCDEYQIIKLMMIM